MIDSIEKNKDQINLSFMISITGSFFEIDKPKSPLIIPFELTPPNIGLQKSFTDYIIKENNNKVTPNLSFLKIIPFMLGNRTSITYDGIKAKLIEFQNMSDTDFQFLNAAVGKMTFGIKELKKVFDDGEEVVAEMQFPNGTSSIFVIHDAFEAYIKE